MWNGLKRNKENKTEYVFLFSECSYQVEANNKIIMIMNKMIILINSNANWTNSCYNTDMFNIIIAFSSSSLSLHYRYDHDHYRHQHYHPPFLLSLPPSPPFLPPLPHLRKTTPHFATMLNWQLCLGISLSCIILTCGYWLLPERQEFLYSLFQILNSFCKMKSGFHNDFTELTDRVHGAFSLIRNAMIRNKALRNSPAMLKISFPVSLKIQGNSGSNGIAVTEDEWSQTCSHERCLCRFSRMWKKN